MGVVKKLADYRPPLEVVEHRVADTEDGFMRVANELTDNLLMADLTARQLKVMLAIMRKTYGFNKPMDRLTNTQIAAMTGIHHTHVCVAKRQLLDRGFLIGSGQRIGINKHVSMWDMKAISQVSKTLATSSNETLAKSANTHLPTQLNTKDNIQKTERQDPPKSPRGESSLAQEVMDYFNQLTGSRCSSLDNFEKVLSTVKSKGQTYTADELKLVIRWAHVTWNHRIKPENLCRMTRFDGYLSDALVWADGHGSNPAACPHAEIISMWNEKFPTKAVAPHEWNRRRPAYRDLEAVWNGKTREGNWRELKHMGMAFDLIGKSSLFINRGSESWLTLDWILNPKNWGSVYEQAINEYRQRKGVTA